jgi:hypothetical protein
MGFCVFVPAFPFIFLVYLKGLVIHRPQSDVLTAEFAEKIASFRAITVVVVQQQRHAGVIRSTTASSEGPAHP